MTKADDILAFFCVSAFFRRTYNRGRNAACLTKAETPYCTVLIPIASQSERDKHHRGNQQHEGSNKHRRDRQSEKRRNVVNVHGNHRE
jgi:hypothetical protein